MDKKQLYESIMKSISKEVKKTLDEYYNNDLDEDWKQNLKGAALGLGLGALTMGGMQSCKTGYNEPEYNSEITYKAPGTDSRPDYQKNATSQEFIDDLKDMYDWDTIPKGTLFINSVDFNDDVPNCKGRGRIHCLEKTQDGGNYKLVRFHHKSVKDSLKQYQILNIDKLEKMDSDAGWVEANTTNSVGGTTECVYANYTKFYRQYSWETGMERVYAKYTSKNGEYMITTIYCDDANSSKHYAKNYKVDKDIYDTYEIGDEYFD